MTTEAPSTLTWADSERLRFAEAADRHPLGPALVFLAETGLRPHELCAARIADADPRDGTLRVWGSRPRSVPVSADALRALNRALLASDASDPRGALFVGPDGNRLSVASLRTGLSEILRDAALAPLPLAGLRIRFVLGALASGARVDQIWRATGIRPATGRRRAKAVHGSA